MAGTCLRNPESVLDVVSGTHRDRHRLARPCSACAARSTSGTRRRHLSAITLLAGVVIAALAVVCPAAATESSEPQRIVVLAIDTSRSMEATDVGSSRIEAAKEAAADFLDSVPEGVAIGVMGFDSSARQRIRVA